MQRVLSALVNRNMDLQCNIQDDDMFLSSSEGEFTVTWDILKAYD